MEPLEPLDLDVPQSLEQQPLPVEAEKKDEMKKEDLEEVATETLPEEPEKEKKGLFKSIFGSIFGGRSKSNVSQVSQKEPEPV